jgi:hypothetical protein
MEYRLNVVYRAVQLFSDDPSDIGRNDSSDHGVLSFLSLH